MLVLLEVVVLFWLRSQAVSWSLNTREGGVGIFWKIKHVGMRCMKVRKVRASWSRVVFVQNTLSPIIMEVENYPK